MLTPTMTICVQCTRSPQTNHKKVYNLKKIITFPQCAEMILSIECELKKIECLLWGLNSRPLVVRFSFRLSTRPTLCHWAKEAAYWNHDDDFYKHHSHKSQMRAHTKTTSGRQCVSTAERWCGRNVIFDSQTSKYNENGHQRLGKKAWCTAFSFHLKRVACVAVDKRRQAPPHRHPYVQCSNARLLCWPNR